jgi:hypothetical protein
MTDETKQTRQFIRDRVLKYITDRPGQVVYVNEILEAYPTFKLPSIQSAMHNITNDSRVPGLSVVVKSRAWTYTPNKPAKEKVSVPAIEPESVTEKEPVKAEETSKKRMLFEMIGSAKDGSLILECEKGDLYRATEL